MKSSIVSTRRGFLTGMASLFAAPAIVHPGNLMPIKVLPFDPYMMIRGTDAFGNLIEKRIFELNNRPDDFVSIDFFDRFSEATRFMHGVTSAIVTSRDEEKKARFVAPASWSGNSANDGATPDYVMIRHEHRPTKFITDQKSWRTAAVEPSDPLFHADKRWLDANSMWVSG